MSIVYLAIDPDDALTAVKILPSSYAKKEPRNRIRFKREQQFNKRIPNHPALAGLKSIGHVNDVEYIALEYCHGLTLRQHVMKNGVLSVGPACRLFVDIAHALSVVHFCGIIHRDVKPSNLLLTESGRGKLLDFGLALQAGEPNPSDPALLGGPGYTLGTMDYLSPEQSRNAFEIGPTADLYSLGCSLFYALCGRPPFVAESTQDKIAMHRRSVPPKLSAIDPRIPSDLAIFIHELLSKSPEARPSSATEVAMNLQRWSDPIQPRLQSHDSSYRVEKIVQQLDNEWCNQIKLKK